jgi:hypothetical protein
MRYYLLLLRDAGFRSVEENSTRGVLSEMLSVVLSEVLKREKLRKNLPSKDTPWLSTIGGQPEKRAKVVSRCREQPRRTTNKPSAIGRRL